MENFLSKAEEYIARYEPGKTAEEVFLEMQRVVQMHKRFDRYLKKNPNLKKQIESMPKKSEQILERRRLFINWYIQRNKGRYLHEVVEELTYLTFASETTIHNVVYNYR